ncbi:hypothetical protein Tco_1080916 [Tanacetum coccineum]|uniref:Uncharacterized protein n=1 Tax=Tanacetum coccineum TaxID=301880 RepID=A0ABQ5HW42_9ASTR
MEDEENHASHFLHTFLSPIRMNLFVLIRNLNATPCEKGVTGHPSGRLKCHTVHLRPGGSTILDVSSIGEYLVDIHVVCLAVDTLEAAVVRLEIAAKTHIAMVDRLRVTSDVNVRELVTSDGRLFFYFGSGHYFKYCLAKLDHEGSRKSKVILDQAEGRLSFPSKSWNRKQLPSVVISSFKLHSCTERLLLDLDASHELLGFRE